MQNLRQLNLIGFLLFAVFSVIGCIEDEVEITIARDGSGTVKRTMVLSDRVLIGTKDKSSDGNMNFPLTKADLEKQVGDAMTIQRLDMKQRPDGGRELVVEGRFKSATNFFTSKFAREELDLTLKKTPHGAELVWNTDAEGNNQITLNQMYGLAKGMYVRRSITLPTRLQSDTAQITGDGRTVTWKMDLRSREGLERTRMLLGDNGGAQLTATFSPRSVRFEIPDSQPAVEALRSEVESVPKKVAVDVGDAGLRADLIGLEWRRTKTLDEDFRLDGSLTLHLKLHWDEHAKPEAYHAPKLESLTDDTGQSLLLENQWDHRTSVEHVRDQSTNVNLTVKAPASNATRLQNIKGYINVVRRVDSKTYTLDNPGAIAGKALTGVAELDKLGFTVDEIEGKNVKLTMVGIKEKLEDLEFIDGIGVTHRKQSWGGWQDTYTYSFSVPVEGARALKIKMRLKEETAIVPFSARSLELP